MPRFSSVAKKIFDLIWYYYDIEQSKIIFKELTKSLDFAFAKIWFAYYFFTFRKPDIALTELKEAEKINQSNRDDFNSFFITTFHFMYYVGWNSPTVNIELAKKYFGDLKSIYNQINYFDDWERYFCEGIQYVSEAFYSSEYETNIERGIKLLEMSKESFRLVPEDGEFLSQVIGNINLGLLQRSAGYFDEAEMNYQKAYTKADKDAIILKNTALWNIGLLNIQKGELKKAMEFNEKSYILSKELNDSMSLYLNL